MGLTYNLGLCLAIWGFYVANLFVALADGQGVIYLGPGGVRVHIPAWRSRFNKRFVALANPFRSYWPVAHVQLLARSEDGAAQSLFQQAGQIETIFRTLRPLLMVVTVLVVVLIPAALLFQPGGRLFLPLLAGAYGVYLLALGLCRFIPGQQQITLSATDWKTLFEPLLCIPYAAQSLRKLSLSLLPSVPLVDLLKSGVELDEQNLFDLLACINDYKDAMEDAAEVAHLNELESLIRQRSGIQTA